MTLSQTPGMKKGKIESTDSFFLGGVITLFSSILKFSQVTYRDLTIIYNKWITSIA